MAGNFAALWPTDSFSALKISNPFKIVPKVQDASNILRVGFALSKWPHFNSTYLVRVPFLTGIAVHMVSYRTPMITVKTIIKVNFLFQLHVYSTYALLALAHRKSNTVHW